MYPTPPSKEQATYEIRLQTTPPSWLQQQFDTFEVSSERTQTALFRSVSSADELDWLLARLASLGLALAEVHEQQLPPVAIRTAGSGAHPSNYEVRVDGRLGDTFLHFLRWRHCVVPPQTSIRVDVTPDDVLKLLAVCSDLGLGIERVRRVARIP